MISAVITAAGLSVRYKKDKLWEEIEGVPVIGRTILQFEKVRQIGEIIIVVRQDNKEHFENLLGKMKIVKGRLVKGGEERLISVYRGVRAARGETVITHDGSRPAVPVNLIKRLVKATRKYGSVMTALPVTATIKKIREGFVEESMPRDETWIAQTPQAYSRELALRAYKKAIKDRYFIATDDSELVARLGEKVRVIPGDERNIKITTPTDLLIAQQIWREDEDSL